MDIDTETVVYVVGLGACLVASVYLYFRGEKSAAVFLGLGFSFLLQSVLYTAYAESPVGSGDCWLKKSFYECLPIEARISVHAAQAGSYVLAIGVLLVARSSKRKAGNGS